MVASELLIGYDVLHRYMARRAQKGKSPELFGDDGNAKWITIGGEPGADGKKHGGHPVKVSGDGTMLTGKFAGKTLDEAFGKGKKPEGSDDVDLTGYPPINPGWKGTKAEFKAHIDKLRSLAKAYDEKKLGATVTDVTPPGYGPSEPEGKPSQPEPPKAEPKQPEQPPGDGIARVSADQLGDGSDGTYDTMHAGLASEFVQSRIAKGMEGIEGREYGIFQHSPGKWQMVSRKKQAAKPVEKPVENPASESKPVIEPKPPATPVDKPEPKSATSLFGEAIDSGGTPREAAKAAQKKLDEDYIYARASEVGNAGEDLKGSARHKVNAWRGLEQAEKDGNADKLVNRDSLMKLEPTNFVAQAQDKPLLSLTMHFAIKSFPPKPGDRNGTPEKNRKEYLEAYREIKAKAEELVDKYSDTEALGAMSELRSFASNKINQLRGQKIPDPKSTVPVSDRYNQTANDLINFTNNLSPYSSNKTSVGGKFNEFGKEVERKYGVSIHTANKGDIETKKAYWANLTKHAQDIIEGASINDTFGKESEKRTVRRFNPSEAYVSYAKREGGRDLSKITEDPNKAVKHMVDELQIRGVQWGNSVTDDERKHHAGKVVEAITDLADVVGLHPKDFSLGGKLGLAIGARGKGNASAHYEPGSQVINLTRASGVGALAHEWGHAFDHMLADFKTSLKDSSYMSENSEFTHEIVDDATGRTFDVPHGAKPHKGYSIREKPRSDIRKAYNSWKESCKPYRERLRKVLQEHVRNGTMSHAKAQNYWASGREVFARTFERHVKHKLEDDGRQNTYLSGLGGDHPLWPTAEEAKGMAPAFDAIFEAFRKEKYGSPDKVKFSRVEAAREIMAAWGYYPSALEAVDRYARKSPKSSPGQMTFDDHDGGRWITIGGEHGADGGKHGGHPVYIGKDGEMKTGKFAGKTLGEAFGGGKSPEQTTGPKSKSPESKKFSGIQEQSIQQSSDRIDSVDEKITDLNRKIESLDEQLDPLLEKEHAIESMLREVQRSKDKSKDDRMTQFFIQKQNKYATELDSVRSYINPIRSQIAEMNAQIKSLTQTPGITFDTRSNESAKPDDQMGLFGDVSNVPKGKARLSPGGETKGKQLSMFDTKGDPDQMLMFDDGVTPEDRVMKFGRSGSIRDRAAELIRYWGLSADRLGELFKYAGKSQLMFDWDESKHPRETKKHDNKLPGQFAPKHASLGSAYDEWSSRRHKVVGDHPTSFLTGHSSAPVREEAKKNPGIGLLITPNTPQYVGHITDYSHVAIDNGVYSEFTGSAPFDEGKFRKLLDKVAKDPESKAKVKFVVAPDVVGDWQKTVERSKPWLKEIRDRGFPVAWVAQDGIEKNTDQIPWDDFDVLFVGGSTAWKLGFNPINGNPLRPTDSDLQKAGVNYDQAKLIKEAKKRGKKIHIGRVNSWKRAEMANYGVQAHTMDGNFIGVAPDQNLPKVKSWLESITHNMEKPTREVDVDRYSATWDESKHPRDEMGQFAEVGHSFTAVPHRGNDPSVMQISKLDDSHALVSNQWGMTAKVPRESLQHMRADLTGDIRYLAPHGTSGNDSIDRVISGGAKYIGKGNDSVVWDSLDGNVVKSSTTVPYHAVGGPGHQTPENARKAARKQFDAYQDLKKAGVKGLPNQSIAEHGDRVFTTQEKLNILDKYTPEQARQAAELIKSLHDAGYAFNDELQFGIDSQGQMKFFDFGTVKKNDATWGINQDDQAMDRSKLGRIFQQAGIENELLDPPHIAANNAGSLLAQLEKRRSRGQDLDNKEKLLLANAAESLRKAGSEDAFTFISAMQAGLSVVEAADFVSEHDHDDYLKSILKPLSLRFPDVKKHIKYSSIREHASELIRYWGIGLDIEKLEYAGKSQMAFNWDESEHPRASAGKSDGGQFISKSEKSLTQTPGITFDTRSNDSAKPNDQMGLFGDVSNVPRGKATLPPGGESKGKQLSMFDTKGDPDQMLMFDDGVTPEDRVMKPEGKESIRDKANKLVDFWMPGAGEKTKKDSLTSSKLSDKLPVSPATSAGADSSKNEPSGSQPSTKETKKMEKSTVTPTGVKLQISDDGRLLEATKAGKTMKFMLENLSPKPMLKQGADLIRSMKLNPHQFTFYGSWAGKHLFVHDDNKEFIDYHIAARSEVALAEKKEEEDSNKEVQQKIDSGEKRISPKWHDGEILSGYTVHGYEAEKLKELGLAKSVSGWGTLVDSDVVKKLGSSFTLVDAQEYARPAMEARKAKESKSQEERRAIFEKAKSTGEKQLLNRYTENVDEEDNSLNIIHEYAMPDGSVKTETTRTY